MSMEIQGLDQFMSWANNTPRQLTDEAKRAVTLRTLEMEVNSKNLAPVGDTGNLRRSITSDVKGSGNSVTGEVTTNIEYNAYVEFGTSRQNAQPYLTPSYVNSSKNLEGDLRRLMGGFR